MFYTTNINNTKYIVVIAGLVLGRSDLNISGLLCFIPRAFVVTKWNLRFGFSSGLPDTVG